MPRYDVFLEGRAESSTRYFAVSVMANDPKEAEFLGHEAGRVKHQECDEIEVVGVMSVTSDLNAGKGRLYLDSKILPGELQALVLVSNCLEREFVHRQLATGQPLHTNL